MQPPTQEKEAADAELGSYAGYLLLSSTGGKVADAIGVVITIKALATADYGVIGTALGLVAVLGFVNLAPEEILWRDLPKLRKDLSEHISAYVWFWLVKLALVGFVALALCVVYGMAHGSWGVAASAFAIAFWLQVLSASTLVGVPLFAGLQQQRGACLVLGVRLLWLALLVPNLWLHSLGYYIVALAVYALGTATISWRLLQQHFGVTLRLGAERAWTLVRSAVMDFTLWLHLVGRSRSFLQRGDLAILGGVGLTLAAVGGYTVAINLVGFAFLMPSILENVAAVSFAHRPEQRIPNLRRFVIIAAGLAGVQFLGGLLGGHVVLRLLHVADVESTFGVLLILLAGSSVFALACPVLAYAMCFRRMQKVFVRVFLPAVAVFVVAVWVAGRQWGVTGAAVAHAAVMGVAGVATIIYVSATRDVPAVVEPAAAGAESAFQE